MSFNTFVPDEYHYWDTSYWQQYTILANLVRDSWRQNHHASDALQEYLQKIASSFASDEDAAWDIIWNKEKERSDVLKTMWKLRTMLPQHQYVTEINAQIFHVKHHSDLRKLLDENGLLFRFFPNKDDQEFQAAAIRNNEHAMTYLPELASRPDGVYTNKGDKLSAIGDLHGDFAATIRVLQNMNIIQVDADKHTINVHRMTVNHDNQLQKLASPVELPYVPLDYTAYTWIYANNMLVQTGDLFDRGFNSREIIEVFMHLDSTSGDGQVVNMAGNHEFMQYQYGMSEMDFYYKGYQIPKDSMSFGQSQNWDTNRTTNLAPGSKYFEWIARLPIIVYETKSKTVFSHGCVVEKWTNVQAINKSVGQIWYNVRRAWESSRSITTVFENIASDSPLNCVINGRHTEALSEVDGPVWNRYYNNAVKQQHNDELQDQLERTVKSFATNHMQVDRLICAHTITNMKHIQEELTMGNDCKFKPEQHPVGQTPSVWFIDLGMTEGYGEGKRWGGVELTTSEGGGTQVEAKHPHC